MPNNLLPKTGKPRLTAAQLRELLTRYAIDRTKHPFIVVGIRGYYRDNMGAPGVNDRGIYDDAIFIDSPSVMAAYNGNTDPSAYRKGKGTGSQKGMASLNPGAWFAHRFDKHNGKYLALCQRLAAVTVTRDGDPPYPDTGYHGINIHKGSYRGTSSIGCQTVHPDQWDSFIALAVDQAKRYHDARWNKVVIPYVLIAT
jgi:lysozyme